MSSIRRALLAKVHIALKDLGIDDDLYRLILREEFGVASSAALSARELEALIARFESKGWKPSRTPKSKAQSAQAQVDALKERIGQKLIYSDFDETRLRGLVRRICGVDDLRWCGDAVRLKRLLAVIGSMMERGDIKVVQGT
jgi:phage gp16-like protein